jgi:hypothetical protein
MGSPPPEPRRSRTSASGSSGAASGVRLRHPYAAQGRTELGPSPFGRGSDRHEQADEHQPQPACHPLHERQPAEHGQRRADDLSAAPCRPLGPFAVSRTPPQRGLEHPAPYPQGLRRAFAYYSEDGQEITGVSFWESKEACDAWRASEPEAQRRAGMAPYVVEEREGFYRGRELAIP